MLKFEKKTPNNTKLGTFIGKSEGAIRRYIKEDQAEYTKILNQYKEENYPFLTLEEYSEIKNIPIDELSERIEKNLIPFTRYVDGNGKETIYLPTILEDYIDISKEIDELNLGPRIIGIGNFKGGVCKTTNSCNIASSLAYLGNRVLLVDNDVQGNASTAFGITIDKELNGDKFTLVELMTKIYEDNFEKDLKNSLVNININQYFSNELKGSLDILPNSPNSIYLAEDLPSYSRELGTMENVLKKVLEAIKDNYDYIIIDMPPRADLFLRMSIMASDYLIFSLTPTVFSDKGIPSLMIPIQKQQQIYKKENNKEFIILGAINSKTKANINTQSIISENSNDQIKRLIGDENKLFKTSIAEASVVEDSQTGNGSVLFYKPTEKTVKLYFELTLEILERIYTLEMLRK